MAEIDIRTGDKQVDFIIERLRESRARFLTRRIDSGRGRGENWVRYFAEAEQLERLVNLTANPDYWEDFLRPDTEKAYVLGERLYFELFPNDFGDRQAAADFFNGVVRDKYCDPDYIEAFVDGALDFWAQVEPEVLKGVLSSEQVNSADLPAG